MGCLHYHRSYWSRRSLRTWWSLSTGGPGGPPFPLWSSIIRGSSTIRGLPSGYPPLLGGLLSLLGYLPLSDIFHSDLDTSLFQGVSNLYMIYYHHYYLPDTPFSMTQKFLEDITFLGVFLLNSNVLQ